jgi:hypothetical protein
VLNLTKSKKTIVKRLLQLLNNLISHTLGTAGAGAGAAWNDAVPQALLFFTFGQLPALEV